MYENPQPLIHTIQKNRFEIDMIFKCDIKQQRYREFYSGSMLRTLYFHFGAWIQSLIEKLRSYKLCGIAQTNPSVSLNK